MEKALSVKMDLDPSFKKFLIVRPLGSRHEELIPCLGKDEVDIHPAKHSGLQGLEIGSSGMKYGVVILICLRAP